MPVTLPQFQSGVACADGKHPNSACNACRKIGPEYDHWRLANGGSAQFDCPHGYQMGKHVQLRGLGDAIERVTQAVGIKPCGGCKDRRDKLNELVPFE
jgi:hypothetical protein